MEPQTCQVYSPPTPNTSRCFSNLFNAYARAFNLAYGRTGALFQRPFQRIAVHDECYFVNLVYYIHFNPQKHGFVDDFREWPYSSFGTLASASRTRLARDEVWDWFGGIDGLRRAHEQALPEREIAPLVGDDFT
jgi:hypothetical protein